jgi:hypothetical protein
MPAIFSPRQWALTTDNAYIDCGRCATSVSRGHAYAAFQLFKEPTMAEKKSPLPRPTGRNANAGGGADADSDRDAPPPEQAPGEGDPRTQKPPLKIKEIEDLEDDAKGG